MLRLPLPRNTLPEMARAFRESVAAYLKDMEERNLAETTRRKAKNAIYRFERAMVRVKRPFLPQQVRREDVKAWKDLSGATPANQQHNVSMVNGWLNFHHNRDAMLTGVRWEKDDREVGRWLTVAEKLAVEAAAKGWTRWAVHCGFRLCTRRKEWRLIRVQDVDLAHGVVHIVSPKGKRLRSVPVSASTAAEFSAVMQLREELVAANPGLPVDDTVLLVRYGRRLQTPGFTTVDGWIMEASEAAGIAFTSHDMRRTGARHLYDAGMKVHVIQRILGHRKQETTIRYLGVLFEETANEMAAAEAREAELVAARAKLAAEGARPVSGRLAA